ncbi:polysialyltransferase family glycosyltransferase [Halobacillus salinus]|uniref:Uncharacterized protein n=1 Tax=Halobacillus salinus TaxID=192814 RepID=A0A4Z0GZB7_9BACI|nr:polysialyltransferase family glycosyltransferase [Halobacillus salinus]TGB02735.1 hypothetical protein E4663_11280 [Halobacillus salinus]
MKKEKVCFVVSSNYQIMISYFIQQYAEFDCGVISYSINEQVNGIAEAVFDDCLVLPRLKKDWKSLMWRNRKVFQKAAEFVREKQPDKVIVFKDNDYINASIIEESVEIGSKVMMIQEGLGVYTHHRVNRWKKWIRRGLRLFGYPKLYSEQQAMNPNVEWIAINDQEQFPSYKKEGREIVDLPHALPDHEHIQKLARQIGVSIPYRESSNPCLLFLGQPLSEINLVEEGEERTYLSKVFECIRASGYDLYIKPHPSEQRSKYESTHEATLLGESIPAELLPAFIPISMIVTSSSSAADNIALAHQIPALYLHHLTIKEPLDYEKKMNGSFINSYEALEERLVRHRSGQRTVKQQLTRQKSSFRDFAESIMRY